MTDKLDHLLVVFWQLTASFFECTGHTWRILESVSQRAFLDNLVAKCWLVSSRNILYKILLKKCCTYKSTQTEKIWATQCTKCQFEKLQRAVCVQPKSMCEVLTITRFTFLNVIRIYHAAETYFKKQLTINLNGKT